MALVWVLPVALGAWLTVSPLLAGFSVVSALSVSSLPDRVDFALKSFLTHRGGTHTVWFAGIAALTSTFIGYFIATTAVQAARQSGVATYLPVATLASVEPLPLAAAVGLSTFLSICSHLAADALTVGRGSNTIRLFWPLSSQALYFGYTRSDSRLWNAGLLGIGLAVHIGTAGVLVLL